MSVEAMSWVFQNSQAKLGARLVLLALANHAHADGTSCWASVATLAKAAFVSERQTQRCLRALIELGEIEQTGTHHSGTRIYRILGMSPGGRIDGGVTNETGEMRDLSPKPLEPSVPLEERLRRTNRELVAHYVEHSESLGVVLPVRVKGATAQQVGLLTREGQEPKHIRRALELLTEKGLNPASLPSLVVEAQREGQRNGKHGLTAAQILALPAEEML